MNAMANDLQTALTDLPSGAINKKICISALLRTSMKQVDYLQHER